MKQFFKMFFASLLAIIVSCVILFGFLIGSLIGLASKANKDGKTKPNSVLVIDVQRQMHEIGQNNPFAIFSDGSGTTGLYKAIAAIQHAKTDNDIKGILIKLGANRNGWATSEQLREAINDFRSSKKFVYAYGEDITQGAYYIATAADSIYVNPAGDMELKGFSTELAFFKGTLDKLEVQPEIFYAGKFKSATEPFRAYNMSDANRLQIRAFQHSIWNDFLGAVKEHTGLDSATVNQLTQTGAIEFPTDALKYKLVDGLLYWDEVEQRIRIKTGQKEGAAITYVAINDYTDHYVDESKADNKIAVLVAEGAINSGEQNDDYEIAAKTFAENIRKVAKNDKIKAVVLRVNSPGGSALASEVIWRELQLLRKKKPVVVSMGDYAASGGYYISCQADSIFALPNTITGSIGVFGMLFNIHDLMKNKLGVNFDGEKTAPYADFPTASRALTEDEGKRMQRSVDNIYSLFKSRVVTARRLSAADVDSIAQGRVWIGNDAYKVGLVDGLGGFNRALRSAATLAKLSNYKVVVYPEPLDKLKEFFKKMNGNADASEMVQAKLKQEMGEEFSWLKKIKELKSMNGKAMMAMPFIFNVE